MKYIKVKMNDKKLQYQLRQGKLFQSNCKKLGRKVDENLIFIVYSRKQIEAPHLFYTQMCPS